MSMEIQDRWCNQEFGRQIKATSFKSAVPYLGKLSTVLREVHPQVAKFFKDVALRFQTEEKKGKYEVMSYLLHFR